MEQAALAFLALFVLDLVWVGYTRAMIGKDPIRAGVWAAGLLVVNAVATLMYVGNPWLIAPAALGAFCGTAVAVKFFTKS